MRCQLTAEQKDMFEKLSLHKKRFVTAILDGKTRREAYVAAGGRSKIKTSQNAGASLTYNSADVKKFLNSIMESRVSDAIMNRDEALQRLTALARGSISQVVEYDDVEIVEVDGKKIKQTVWRLKDQDKLTEEQTICISELSTTARGFKFKLHDPKVAIKQLADMLGWDAPKKMTLPDGVSFNLNFNGKSDG